jgi:pilus assembly protein Flp/PilA
MLHLFLKAKSALGCLRDEDGQDLIEYALLGALIAVACIASMNGVASGINVYFGRVTANMT